MTRELPRTLLSLSRPYQRIDPDLKYEVIVVDNGSSPPPDAKDFADLELNLTLLQPEIVRSSPVFALNEGLARARADLIGAWIDGARLASPGLLASVYAAAKGLECPVIAPLNWHLGPQRQHLSAAMGYDQTAEDQILAQTGWPETPYGLFAASTCETPDPMGPLLESNALFLRRAAWDALHGYDTAFDEAGGGVANPDMLIRACALPDARLIRIADEGTFHQYHGGVTTTDSIQAALALQQSSRKYYRLRGRPLQPVRKASVLFPSPVRPQ